MATITSRYQAPLPLAGNGAPRIPMTARTRDFRGLDSGVVEVRATIDAEGRVKDAVVQRSELGRAFQMGAIELVREWRFSPATENGQAVAAVVVLPVRYSREPQRFSLLKSAQTSSLRPGGASVVVW